MSQTGLLTEEELRDYINEKFNLRLERDALIKPTKDVIVDIYSRFLDEFHTRWRKPLKTAENEGPNLEASLVKRIRNLISPYKSIYTFQLTDILSPTRQRSRVFLNILIYNREKFEDCLLKLKEGREELMNEVETVTQIKSELAQEKELIEELAIGLSTAESIDELKSINEEKQQALESLKKKCDDMCAEAKLVKESLLTILKSDEHDQAKIAEIDSELTQLKKTAEMLDDGRNIKHTAANLDQAISDLEEKINTTRSSLQDLVKINQIQEKLILISKLNADDIAHANEGRKTAFSEFFVALESGDTNIEQLRSTLLRWQKEEAIAEDKLTSIERTKTNQDLEFKIKQEQARTDQENMINQTKDKERHLVNECDQLRVEIQEIMKKRSSVKTRLDTRLELSKSLVDKADRKLRLLNERVQKTKNDSIVNILFNYQEKINVLMGNKIEVTDKQQAVNRTYIKESNASG